MAIRSDEWARVVTVVAASQLRPVGGGGLGLVLRPAAAGVDDDIQAVADDIDIHVHVDIAWAEGRRRFTNRDGHERPVRMTGVFAREDGQWKVVQSHASIGVPNADIFG
jgi:ketosteroid isomerase-like protein